MKQSDYKCQEIPDSVSTGRRYN